MLFLAQAKMRTVHSPGDDGMTGPFFEDVVRIVEADDSVQAEAKLRANLERDVPYSISVSLEQVRLHEVIR